MTQKDIWDKLTSLSTFFSAVVLALLTFLVDTSFKKFDKQLQENDMVSKVIKDFLNDSSSHFQSDLALLSLERYFRNANDGKLNCADKDMLTGFAQSTLIKRQSNTGIYANEIMAQIIIPTVILQKYDTLKLSVVRKLNLGANVNNVPNSIDSSALSTDKPTITIDITKTSVAIASAIRPTTVYIQYAATDKSKDFAKNIQQTSNERKWSAPGIELVKGSYKNSIRYFHREDESLAKQLLGISNAAGLKTPELIPILKYADVVPKGQIEIWINE